MLWLLRVGMLVLGLMVAGLAVTGIVSLVQRRWGRGFWFGVAATIGSFLTYLASGALAVVFVMPTVDGANLPIEGKARILGETISTLMNWGCLGLFTFPVGFVVAVVGAAGWLRSRPMR